MPSLSRSPEFEGDVAEIYAGTALGVSESKRTLDVPAMVVETLKDAIWSERLSMHKEVPVDPDRTVRHQVALWLGELKGRVDAGQFGAGEYQGQTYYSSYAVPGRTYRGRET